MPLAGNVDAEKNQHKMARASGDREIDDGQARSKFRRGRRKPGMQAVLEAMEVSVARATG